MIIKRLRGENNFNMREVLTIVNTGNCLKSSIRSENYFNELKNLTERLGCLMRMDFQLPLELSKCKL